MSTLLLSNGNLLDEGGSRSLDLVIDQSTGTITSTGAPGSLSADVTIAIDGCIVAPGFVDLHAHLREPGDEGTETFLTASRAAALGGYTAVVATSDTSPPIDNAGLVVAAAQRAQGALCQIIQAGCVSVSRSGEVLAPLAEMAKEGVTVFGDSGSGIQDASFLRRALDYLGDVRTDIGSRPVLAQRCERQDLSNGGHMHEGEWSSKLGIEGIPGQGEELMVAQSIMMAQLTGCGIHLQHLSTAASFALVRSAKAAGVALTADISPCHLLFSDEACQDFDTAFKMSPPLRTFDDVIAAKEALLDGTIDAIATGHSPHGADLKERPFDQAPFGVIGLETTLAAMLSGIDIPLESLVGLLSWRPAQIAGLPNQGQPLEAGNPANLVVLDLNKSWKVNPTSMASRSSNTPFAGSTFTGKIRHTVSNGELVVENFEVKR